jgi:hypothetical protein
MFSDISVAHYRLILESYEIKEIPTTIFRGKTMNIGGRAAFIYEFADSEAFFLDGKEDEWKMSELNKEIKIEAVLVQDRTGCSVLKNWKIN